MLAFLFFQLVALADSSANSILLNEVIVQKTISQGMMTPLPAVKNGFLFTGKKTEQIKISGVPTNLSERVGRQIFAKIPGAFIYDMDGSGNQMNFSFRGLDSHRGWEFNLRHDGVLINSDLYGYPASHYSMPLESIESIEIIRGTGSLQYGAQFGGMVNYVGKKPHTSKPLYFENISSLGSFNSYSNFSSISGTLGRFSYSAYLANRSSDGYRDETHSQYDAQKIELNYAFRTNLTAQLKWVRSQYLFRMAGPLTDDMFYQNPRQATRTRNYFNPTISIPSMEINWAPTKHTQIKWVSSLLLGVRNSILFDKPADVIDMRSSAGSYATRQVDIDRFNSWTNEIRMIESYRKGTIAMGAQFLSNDLHRRQLGQGSVGTDFDLTISDAGFVRDMHYRTNNLAFFIENKWNITPKLAWNVGIRMEHGTTTMSGTITYLDASKVPNQIRHQFPLLGSSFEYQLVENQQLYGGIAQAYRPVILKDLIPSTTYDRSDQNLKDASGYNAEIGYRGTWKNFRWDLSVFQMMYNNRMGKISQTDVQGKFYLLQTNIGGSVTRGIESSIQAEFELTSKMNLSVFSATSFMRAKYDSAIIRNGNTNISIHGNFVESVPDWISRNGLTLSYMTFSISGQYSFVGHSYADALNTEKPSQNGAIGLVPSYSLLDLSATWKCKKYVEFKFNMNNALDRSYFTKRPMFYPGPGIWPSDGRSISVGMYVKI